MSTFSQNIKPPSSPEQEDVVRVNTELVQTDVTVFDQRGNFVNGLRREDFELRIDGKPRAISFFDRVTAGSGNEDAQLAAARGESSKDSGGPTPLDRGRLVFFYVDDLHLTPANLGRTRNLLLQFVDNEMGQDDEAVVASPTGQVGFLQQLSDNKDVLHAAIARLQSRPSLVTDSEKPPMSEYQALAIEQNNHDVINYFVDEIMKEMGAMSPTAASRVGTLPTARAEQQVRDRANLIMQQSNMITRNTLSGLESLVLSASKSPGRKLVFFISDGFFLDLQNSDSVDRLRQITSAAAHNAVVIYSVDARGLVTGISDASNEGVPDPSGRLQRIAAGELTASQDGLNALAADTGGRAILNTNGLDAGISKALAETSTYYLLAWRPDNEQQRAEKFRMISVSVIGHPELTVRMRQGFFNAERQPAKATKSEERDTNANGTADNQLRSAILAATTEDQLPIALSLAYVYAPDNRLLLTTSVQVKSNALVFAPSESKEKASVEVVGVVFDEHGKAGANFTDNLNVEKPALDGDARDVVYTYPVTVPAGLYQVRVGLRDRNTGKIGTARDWIKIPDLSKTPLSLSSLVLHERVPTSVATAPADVQALEQSRLSIDHRFHRNSSMQFLAFIYSAKPAANPDVAVQVQILRANQPVLTTSLRRVAVENVSDLSRLAYAAEISLEGLPRGKYVLQLTAIDRGAKQTATQRTRFQIE